MVSLIENGIPCHLENTVLESFPVCVFILILKGVRDSTKNRSQLLSKHKERRRKLSIDKLIN